MKTVILLSLLLAYQAGAQTKEPLNIYGAPGDVYEKPDSTKPTKAVRGRYYKTPYGIGYQSGSYFNYPANRLPADEEIVNWRDLSLAFREYRDSCWIDTLSMQMVDFFYSPCYWTKKMSAVNCHGEDGWLKRGYEYVYYYPRDSSSETEYIFRRTPTLEGFFDFIERKGK